MYFRNNLSSSRKLRYFFRYDNMTIMQEKMKTMYSIDMDNIHTERNYKYGHFISNNLGKCLFTHLQEHILSTL